MDARATFYPIRFHHERMGIIFDRCVTKLSGALENFKVGNFTWKPILFCSILDLPNSYAWMNSYKAVASLTSTGNKRSSFLKLPGPFKKTVFKTADQKDSLKQKLNSKGKKTTFGNGLVNKVIFSTLYYYYYYYYYYHVLFW
jgi:hypothetical protein